MKLQIKSAIQRFFNRFGFQIRKIDKGVSYIDPYQEQKRLLNNESVEVIFEVGAADGRDCDVYTALFPNSKVYAFEPLPDSFAKVVKRAEVNKSIIPFNLALSSKSGEATFFKTDLDDASSLLESRITNSTFDIYQKVVGSIQVQTDTIDNICAANKVEKIDILKMDAQGAELEILKGAINMIKAGKIKMIYTEIQFVQLYKGAPLYHEIAAFLTENNFVLHNLFGFTHNQKGILAWGDALFVSKQIEY